MTDDADPLSAIREAVAMIVRTMTANAMGLAMLLTFLGAALPCAAHDAIVVHVSGKIVRTTPSTHCVLQLASSPLWPVAADQDVHGRFSRKVTFSSSDMPSGDEDRLSADILCNGFRVFSSPNIDVKKGVATVNTGHVDATKRIDDAVCRQLSSTDGASIYRDLMTAFPREAQIDERGLAPARVELCDNRYELFRQSRFPMPGAHWVIRQDRQSGKITVDYGR